MLDATSVRLTPGSHSSPRDGACVVELASLIAGEEFSDHPRCVDPVIAAFLRGWNDRAADANRQRLRPYAERVIGSAGSRESTRARREVCLRWAAGDPGRGPRRALRRALTRLRIAAHCGLPAAVRLDEGAGDYAARVAFSRRDYAGAFVLLNAMLAIGSREMIAPLAVAGRVHGAQANGAGANGAGANGAGANGAGSASGDSARAREPAG